jgi:Ca2+/H+ antiporter
MDNLDKASAAFTKHIVWWLRIMFLMAFLALIVVGLIDAGFASVPFLALMVAGIIAAFLKPVRR